MYHDIHIANTDGINAFTARNTLAAQRGGTEDIITIHLIQAGHESTRADLHIRIIVIVNDAPLDGQVIVGIELHGGLSRADVGAGRRVDVTVVIHAGFRTDESILDARARTQVCAKNRIVVNLVRRERNLSDNRTGLVGSRHQIQVEDTGIDHLGLNLNTVAVIQAELRPQASL